MNKRLVSIVTAVLLSALFLVSCTAAPAETIADAAEPEAAVEDVAGDSTDIAEAPEETTEEASSDEPAEENVADDGNSSDNEVTVIHDLGEITLPANPAKVVSFDLGVVDSLNSAGIEVGGLPQETLPEYLSEFGGDEYLNAGTMKEADFEGIYAYDPDLIIISDRMAEQYDAFAEIAPTLYLPMPGTPYIETVQQNIDQLKEVYTDKADTFDAEMGEIAGEIEQLSSEVDPDKTALIVMANDSDLSVYGKDSRFGIIHNEFGFAPADETIDDSTHGQAVTFEYIQEVNPDYIFVIDRSAAIGQGESSGAQDLLDNDLVNDTNAAKDGNIVYLSSDVWYLANGGTQATQQMIAEVAGALK